jgi:uncharacterized protein YehS (DUF1456 family)
MTKKDLKKLKIKLALEGHGSKSRLTKMLGCKNSQISRFLKTGKIAPRYEAKILEWLKKDEIEKFNYTIAS